MSSIRSARAVRSARERFRPYIDTDTFASAKLRLSSASKLLSTTDTVLPEDEVVRFIAPAGSFAPRADYVAVTDFNMLVGKVGDPQPLSFPLNEVNIRSSRNLNSWSASPDTLVIEHGDLVYKIARVPPPDHGIIGELVERGRKIALAARPDIFEKLAAAREVMHPAPPAATPDAAPAFSQELIAEPADMGTAITQLRQLNELRESGALSQSEFELAKQRLGF